MALSRTGKIWLIVLSIPVVLILAAVIGLKLYFTGDRLKKLIIPEVEKTTHRTVSVRDASFSIFPRFSVQIEGVRISNKEGTTFDRDEFLSIERIDLDVRIMELFHDKLDIAHLIIEKPKVYLEVTKEGISNYSDNEPGERSGDTHVNVKSDKSGVVLLSNFEIHDAVIEYYDKKGDLCTIINGLSETGSAQKANGSNIITFTTEATIDKFSFGTISSFWVKDIPLKAKGTLSFKDEHQTLSLDDVTAMVGELPLTATGTIANLFEARDFDITIKAKNGEMKQVLSLIPPDMLKAAKGLSSSGSVQSLITMKGESTDDIQPEINGTFSIANGTIQYTSLPKSITNVNVEGSFSRPAGERVHPPAGKFGVSKFSASLGTNTITGNFAVIDFNDPAVSASFNGSMNLNEVKEFYPLEQGTELTGSMKGNLSLNGKAKEPTSMKASGAIDFQNATIKTATSKSPISNLNGTITFNNQSIESKKISMNMGQSDLALSFTMKNYLGMVMKDAAKAGKPNATLTLTSKQLRTADLMSDEQPAAPTTSDKKASQPKQAMMLPGMDIDANVTVGKLVTEKFEFTNAKGALAVRDGVVNLKNFSVNAFEGVVATKGTLDLRDPKKRPFKLDLDIKGVQSNSMLSKFSSFGNNLMGKLSMTTKLEGDLDDTLGLVRQALIGDGNVQVTDGALKGFAVMSSLSALTGLNELKDINFNNWTNVFSISNGRVNIRDLRVKSGSTEFVVNGSHGLDGSLDYNLNVKLPSSVSDRLKLPGVADQLVQFFKESDGRIGLNFLVTGMQTSPSLKLDTKAQEDLAKKAAMQKLNEGKNKIEDELKKKLGEGLNNLFKKKP